MRVKIEEKNSLPLVKYGTISGEHYALLDTGCDNTLTYFKEIEIEDTGVTIIGLGGNKQNNARPDHVEFDLDDADSEYSYETYDCDAVIVSPEVFKAFEENGIPDVEMILGMNFFKKYQAKIDLENGYLTLK